MIDITSIGIGVSTEKLTKGTKELDNFGKSAKNAATQADQSTKSMGAMTSSAGRLVAILGAAGLGAALIKTIDSYTKYNAQLKLATQTQAQFNTALADVQRIARTAQSDISSVATLYARLNTSLRDVGVSQAEVARITENVGLALKVSGAGAGESASAILQLSQAFASGVLRGEEFNAVSESAPVLMRALAESMGVPIGQLRSMAAEGKITGEILNRAFGDEKLLAKFREQAKEVQTIGGAFTQLKNSIMLLGGEIANQSGGGVAFAKILSTIANSIQSLANVIKGDLKSALNDILPAYERFKQLQEKEAKTLPVARNASGQILPNNALITDRRDIGKIGDASPFSALMAEFNKFKSENPLKDIQVINEEYAKSIKLIRDNVAVLNITPEEGRRYEAQLKKNYEAATKQDKNLEDSKEKAAKREEEVRKYLFNLKNELDDEATKRYNQAEKISKELRIKNEKEVAEARAKYMAIEQDRANDNFKEAQEAYKKQAEEYNKIFDRANENLSRSLTDSIVRGFERGEKFIDNFKKAITTAFRSYFVNIGVNFAQNALSGVASKLGGAVLQSIGMGNAETAQGGGFSSVFKDLGSIFTTSNQSVIGGIESIGASIADGMGGIRDTIGGYLGANAKLVANVASYGGAVLQLAQGNWAGAAGTALGTYLGGPVGGAIGSFLGGAVGGLFGSKKRTPRYSSGVSTTYENGQFNATNLSRIAGFNKDAGGREGMTNAAEIFSKSLGTLLGSFGINSVINTNLEFFRRKGAWGWGSASVDGVASAGTGRIYNRDQNKAYEEFINAFLTVGLVNAIKVSKLPDALKALFDGFTDRTQLGNMIQAVVNLGNAQDGLTKTYALTANQAGQVAQATGLAGDELIAFVNKLASVGSASLTVGDALVKVRNAMMESFGGTMYNSIAEFDSALKSIDKTTQAGIETFAELFQLRDQFVQFQTQIDSLKTGVRGSLFGIVSEAEKQSMLQEDLAKAFGTLGLSVPSTIQELISLGKSIDYTTAEGLNLASVFPSLVTAFNQTQDAVESLMRSLNPDNFRTFFDYAVASSYTAQGLPLPDMPSYAVGTPYVPNDGVAMLHQGEAVLTRGENSAMSLNSGKMVVLIESLISKVGALEYDMRQAADGAQRTARELEDIASGDVVISTKVV